MKFFILWYRRGEKKGNKFGEACENFIYFKLISYSPWFLFFFFINFFPFFPTNFSRSKWTVIILPINDWCVEYLSTKDAHVHHVQLLFELSPKSPPNAWHLFGWLPKSPPLFVSKVCIRMTLAGRGTPFFRNYPNYKLKGDLLPLDVIGSSVHPGDFKTISNCCILHKNNVLYYSVFMFHESCMQMLKLKTLKIIYSKWKLLIKRRTQTPVLEFI